MKWRLKCLRQVCHASTCSWSSSLVLAVSMTSLAYSKVQGIYHCKSLVMVSITRINSNDDNANPWCTHTFTEKLSDPAAADLAWLLVLTYIIWTHLMSFSGMPWLHSEYQISWWGTWSKDFSRSRNTIWNCLCFSMCFSRIWCTAKTVSIVLTPLL